MDRRKPPTFRSSPTADASPSRDRATAGSSINRSYNRPWGSGGGTSAAASSESAAHARYSSLRSSSPASPSPRRNTHQDGSSSMPSSSSHSSPYSGGVDTTTTIDGSRGSVSAGLSSYERYRSLRLQTGSGGTASNASSPVPTNTGGTVASTSPYASPMPLTSSHSATTRSASPSSPATGASPRSKSTSTSYATRSSSPREMRKQRLQQQYASSGRTSPYRGQEQSTRAASPAATQPKDKNEEWLDRIRQSNAARTNAQQEQSPPVPSKEKKAKKIKKSSSARKLEADAEDGESRGAKKSHRKSRKSSAASSEDDESTKKKKKKHSRSTSKARTSRSSRGSKRHSSNASCSSADDISEDDLQDATAAAAATTTTTTTTTSIPQQASSSKTPTNSAMEEPSIQAALAKLGGGTSTTSTPAKTSVSATQSRLAALQQRSSLEATQRVPPSAQTPGVPKVRPHLKPAATTPQDEKPNTTNSAVRGWSTYRRKKVDAGESGTENTESTKSNPFVRTSGEANKVSQYLNMRKSTTTAPMNSFTPTDKAGGDQGGPAYSLVHSPSMGSFGGPMSETTTDDDESYSSSSSEEEDEVVPSANTPEWSVRVCVVSAIDLPANVVPTVPFSPVLKVGLVDLKAKKHREEVSDEENGPSTSKSAANTNKSEQQIQEDLKQSIHVSGLTSVSKARVRSTTAKVMSKRDNGSVEFHEEMRWDANQSPEQMAFAIELSARAIMTPSNYKESPYEPTAKDTSAVRETSIGSSSTTDGRRKGLFRGTLKKRPSSEMEVAKAAAAVAKQLVAGEDKKSEDGNNDEVGPLFDSNSSNMRNLNSNQSSSEVNVKLIEKNKKTRFRMTDDIRLGSQIIPLSKLSWRRALKNNEAARIEQWFELETAVGGSPVSKTAKSSRNPSVLLEISFSTPEVLDDSEDDIEEEIEEGRTRSSKKAASFSRRASISIRSQLLKEVKMDEVKEKEEEPVLEPGVIDYVCLVGALSIGDQKADDGASGWVNSSPETGVLEQFPPTADFHAGNGRNVALMDKIEWFCFPEGCRLWRGTTPPNAEELNLVRFSASSPANIATTIASFDACLGCTTSFSWFVLASNSDEYGSSSTKTYGACIRFFVPAPTGIDPTQDDFGQSIRGASLEDKATKRIWVPMALCMTTNLPIVGAMEVMMLRMCEHLSSLVGSQGQIKGLARFFEDVASLVINYQRPIPGVVSCSIPFLSGEPLHLMLPPSNGLPNLPHGASVTSTCRLLGANGIIYVLAAMLTECKILFHSDDIANLCLVAEVMTALMYPFQWSLPYIPVLPVPMMEFIEAPLSYLLGVPTSSLKLVSPDCLEDVVVIDLDSDFSGAFMDEMGRANGSSKSPTPLPASTAANIQKAVYRLLQHNNDDDDDDDEARNGSFPSSRAFPRMEQENQVEREFRISIALEMAGLVRGYQDSLVIGPSSQPMFNVDKFLQSAPILFDEHRGSAIPSSSGLRVLSPRSRRFISVLVTCQHFHQFLEVSESSVLAFFHEVMTELEAYGSKRDMLAVKRVLSLDAQKTIDQLNSILKRAEDKIPQYKVTKPESNALSLNPDEHETTLAATKDFPYSLLCPIFSNKDNDDTQNSRAHGVNQISLEHLVELEKNPWRYQAFLSIELGETKETGFVPVTEKVKLRDAIGERRYHAWKNSIERGDDEDASIHSDDPNANQAIDWTELLAENGDSDSVVQENKDESPADAAKRRVADAKDRDVLRRCLEQARVAGGTSADESKDTGRDLVPEAEAALHSQAARRFLLAILKKRGANETAESHRSRRRSSVSGASKLEARAFEVLLRLGCSMLDSSIEDRDYDSAYALLKLTAGLYRSTTDEAESSTVLYMTERLGHHPIYADLGVWLRAKKMHLSAGAADRVEKEDSTDDAETDEYEAAVATLYEMLGYGIPAEELARFASRVSEENGWFRSERGQSLLLLARRICMRRDQGSAQSSQKTTSDIEMMSPTSTNRKPEVEGVDRGDDRSSSSPQQTDATDEVWTEIGWIHPSAQYSSRFEKEVKRKPPANNEAKNRHMKRSAVTSMTYLGSSVVVTGALDGGVFLARNTRSSGDPTEGGGPGVRGVHLDWGSAGSRYTAQSSTTATDGAYGVGAVSILAATQPANQSYDALQMKPGPSKKSVTDPLEEEELLTAMEGCRVVAGTTCGDLRVWSVKDVLSAVFYAMRGNETGSHAGGDDRTTHRGEGVTSSVISRRRGGVDFAAGSSLTRLKFSLRGRALSGHRGGVSCVDVPSHVYRPDSIISGGADGLIKLWSLRAPGPTSSRRGDAENSIRGSVGTAEQLSPKSKATRNGDAMTILSGHGGRVLCLKTAWHGDRLLSGGADRTVRLWDLAGSGGKCLNSLSGHFGWVTSVKYWGPNTIISASTDRSIALWDARVRNAPLFTLRHHYAPISDILVGARTDPIMISAGGDGTIAAWDFRRLSDSASQSESSQNRQCKVIRRPAGKLYLHDFSSRRRTYGPVQLSRGPSSKSRTVCCLGRDSIIREWDIRSGEVLSEHNTGHCDTISTFSALDGNKLHDSQLENAGTSSVDGTITTSWDGTVRVRRLERR